MRLSSIYLFIVFLFTGVAACSVLQKKDVEKEARAFLTAFQNNLSKSDAEILKQFDTQQSAEAILAAIRILQNKENEFLKCSVNFENAELVFDKGIVNVLAPVSFHSEKLAQEYAAESSVKMILKPKDGSYVISTFDAEAFYKAFADLRIEAEYSVEQAQALKVRQPIFAIAQALQQKFDSVVWYATYNQKRYFYVVEGVWEVDGEKKSTDYTMGLVDDAGTVIIPVEYQLIGTIGFDLPNIVEVKKDGKVGYFDLVSKKLLLDTDHDLIIPYKEGKAMAIVKSDTTYGWIDKDYSYQAGLPSEAAQQWVNTFAFIPDNLKFKGDSLYAYCEIPREPSIGYGILIPPSYLVKSGLLDEKIEGISTTPFPYAGWTDYVETKGTKVQSITDKISAVMTSITERYIEGREEFYTYDRVVFVGPQHDTLEIDNVANAGEVNFKRLDDRLLEVSYEGAYSEMDGEYWDEYNLFKYDYFELGPDTQMKRLKSNRDFAFTQFVKMDSTYLTGDFLVYEDGEQKKRTFLSTATIEYIRAEILATYGFIFPEDGVKQRFEYRDWYNPRYESIEAFREDMTEIDRYNLDFLDKILSLMQKPV
ncbi:YARHG domain-containing protein [Pseudochryseolinea flava]|uniref:YARHG domain-containing protein n=1 Tax=Pseudochryseolinea flava TaxID=2059302 RepID=A0A364Y0G4_9BACT|nr:YARHG domain-containing protein [Pseudochryseolinea flava]RAW00088.1 hypothetical protein DQQ10_16190 [Pseudochryseolinea flava]